MELINEQLKQHNVTYDDVKDNPQWYMEYRTTKEKEDTFIKYSVDRIRKVLKLNKEMALKEAQWFILQWGLAIEESNLKKSFSAKESNTKNEKTL